MRFRIWLHEICDDVKPDIIVFEQLIGFPSQEHGPRFEHLSWLPRPSQEFCDRTRRNYQGIGVGTIKKFATGKGNAKKSAVIAAVKAWGYEPKDDNQADAIALLLCAEAA